MKKRLALSLLAGLLIVLILGDQYLEQSYQLSIGQYIQAMQPFTEEEEAYLSSLPVLIYGSDSNSPPLRYVDTTTLQYKGLVIDYLDALSIELKTPVEFSPMKWQEALDALSQGRIDICDMHASEERSKTFDFTMPFYYQRSVILTKKSSPVQSEKDLDGSTVSGTEGDSIFEYLKSNYSETQVITSTNLEEAINLLQENKVDAVLGDEAVITYFLNHENISDDFYITKDILNEQEAAIAVQKGNTKLLALINKGIARLKTKETMNKIHEKWYGSQPLITKDTQQFKWQFIFQLLTITIVLIFLIFYYWNRELSKEVAKRTHALNASNQVLETTFDGLEQFLLVINNKYQLLEVNQSFAAYAGISKNELKKLSLLNASLLLNEASVKQEIEKTFALNCGFNMTFEHTHRFYKIDGYPLGSEATDSQLLLLIEDITDSNIQQQQLLQSRKMVAVGQLAAGVAHEIRNPLGLIRNHIFLLKRQLKNYFNEEDRDSVRIVEQSIDRINNIIDNLLNFSRQNKQKESEINLKSFVDALVDLNKKNFEQKNALFELNCSPSLRLALPIESMKHILINLMNNSLEAINNNGKLTLSIIEEAHCLTLIFTDNGKGIAKEILPTIFDPFFTTKNPDEGTGLGLYILYNEVSKMNGHVSVQSKEGSGTEFTIKLPLTKDAIHKEATHE